MEHASRSRDLERSRRPAAEPAARRARASFHSDRPRDPLYAAMTHGPAAVAQGQLIRGLFGPAAQLKSGPAVRPLGWVTQLVDYPEDSSGTIATQERFHVRAMDAEFDVTGSTLQKMILTYARTLESFEDEDKRQGGYRLCSFAMDPKGALKRDDRFIADEAHGMKVLDKDLLSVNAEDWIKKYIILTLEQAGQLHYITDPRNQEIFAKHTVVVDVDCQFDRRGQVGFHKDSRGTTAFVNLTFDNEEAMTGTDYYEDLAGDEGLEERLPGLVRKDIGARREGQRLAHANKAVEIESEQLKPYARVSFSDPNRYHSTPRMGHRRRPTGQETTEELIDAVDKIKPGYRDYFEEQPREVLLRWLEPFNLHNLEARAKPKQTMEDKADIAAKMKRRLSGQLDTGQVKQAQLNEEAQVTRTFIRTWVRFVPK
jgi:hypothetical protein